MASSPCNSYYEPPIIAQVITEFFAKSLHIILESRSPYVSSRNYNVDRFTSLPSSSSSSPSRRPRHKWWFNLALRDCPAVLENFDLWRRSNLEPLVIDVLLVHRSSASNATRLSPGGCLLRNFSGKDRFPRSPRMEELETKSEKIVERWVVQYESRKESCFRREVYSGSRKSSGACSHSSEIPTLCKKIYKTICKRMAVMVRSLYVVVKLLPAYKIFRKLNSCGRIHPLSLSHRITSFAEPFTRAEDAEMNQFSFVPIDTPSGRLSLTVSYLPALEDESLEPSTPLSTQFIMDYVGSPTTDPFKRFQSVPSAAPLPRYVSITRQHSWSNEHGGMPSGSPSPSPTYSDSQAMHYNPSVQLPPCHLHDPSPSAISVPHNASVAQKKNTSFEDYLSSSPFLSGSSPSTPTHFPAGHLPNALLCSESAPVCIPSARCGRNVGFLNQALPPSSPKPERPRCSSQTDTLKAQISTATASQTSSTEGKLQTKKEPLRLGYFETCMSLAKTLSFGKDEVGSLLPGLNCNSLDIPFSRSSSRLSLLDKFDDSEFACPFADDEDITESWNRVELSEGKDQVSENLESRGLVPVPRSPDAAVGALVQMLRTASSSNSGLTASGLFKPRTTADALVELRIYKEMKELLLKQRGSKSLGDNHQDKPAGGGSS